MSTIHKPTQYFGNLHQTRLYLLGFMSLFSDIWIERTNENGEIYKYVKVPLQYVSTSKLYKVQTSAQTWTSANDGQRPQNGLNTAALLPRMSVSLNSLDLNTQKVLNKHNSVQGKKLPDGTFQDTYAPVPYTMMVELTVVAKSANDLFQVIEQIIPNFRPSRSFNVRIVEDQRYSDSISAKLEGVSLELPDELEAMELDLKTATLDFVLEANYYRVSVTKEKLKKNVIDNVQLNMGILEDKSYYKFAKYEFEATNPSLPEEIEVKRTSIREGE